MSEDMAGLFRCIIKLFQVSNAYLADRQRHLRYKNMVKEGMRAVTVTTKLILNSDIITKLKYCNNISTLFCQLPNPATRIYARLLKFCP